MLDPPAATPSNFPVLCGRDWLQGRRKQALEALLVSIPAALLETWFFTHLKL